ncbi:MAG: hypothetical protein ONB45_15115 [candidate division KSB1 bacterium]|nr:hypothetical protein [candidate division KSB1 bacterium]
MSRRKTNAFWKEWGYLFTQEDGPEAQTEENWFRINEKENAIDFLEKAAYFLEQKEDQNRWKWVAISLFGSLYGFLICSIQGTNPDRVKIFDKKTDKYLDKLISFPEALKRAQKDEYMQQFVFSKTLKLTKSQKRSINFIHKTFRNTFEHFIPMQWSIETSGMREIVIDVLDVIGFLALESGNPFLMPDQKVRIEHSLELMRNFLLSKT